ncbi:hypothetical protein [Gemmobacter sp.]|uniref:hypothetical protein n=1 Tax=Gemmobacter sp. TaxID=1898957 RepID=UPI0025C163FF|nr:hypothetical protein [Gemmobacter sp.]
MKATIVADFSQFERSARAVASTASTMGRQVSQAMDGAKGAAQANAQAFDALRASVDPAYAASQRYAALQRQVASLVDAGAASQRSANLVLEQAAKQYLGVATASERAQQAQREQNQIAEQAAAKYHALRAALDPLYASSKRYEQAQETLNAAVKAGMISQQEANRVLAMAETQYLGFGQAAGHGAQGLAKFTPRITNASFQIQDFAVQVASGQSALMAFAQQFPQLASVMGVSGKLALVGAGLGALVAVGAAVLPMFVDMTSSANAAEKALDGLTGAVSRYNQYSALAGKSSDDLRAQFGLLSGEAGRAADGLAVFARMDAVNAMTAAVKQLTEEFGGLSRTSMTFERVGGMMPEIVATYNNLQQQLGLTAEQANAVVLGMEAMQQAKTLEEQVKAAVAYNDRLIEVFGSLERIPVALQAGAQQAYLLASSAAEIVNPLEQAKQKGDALLKSARDIVEEYERQAEMARAIALYGENSAQVEKLRRGEAERTAEEIIRQGGYTDIMADRIKSAALYQYEMTRQATATTSAIDILSARIGGLAGQFGPAIMAANQLAQALANAAGQIGAVGGAMVRLSSFGQGLAASGGFIGKLLDAAQISASSGALAVLGNKLSATYREATKVAVAGGSVDDALRAIGVKPVGGGSGGGGGGSAGAAAGAMDEAAEAARRLREQMERPFVAAIDVVADAWGEFVSRGARDFAGFADGVKETFQRLLSSLIAESVKNKLMVWLGIGQTGAVPGQQGASGGAAGGLSGLSGLLGPDSWLGSRLCSGKGFLGGIGKLLGFGGAGAGAGAGGMAGLTGFLGTAGAILGGIGAIIGIGKALFGRTLKDVGVQGSFTGDEFSGQTYKFYKGGLLRSNKTKYSAMDSETTAAIGSAYADLRANIRSMAGVLDLGSDAIADFAHEFKISTKDMSQEQIVQALQEEMAKAGAGMAGLNLGTEAYTKAGETALDAMTRLSSSLSGVRDVADLLGHSFTSAGLIGANLASGLVDAFGGLEAMGSSVQSYWQAFYTEDERVATMTRQARQALADLGATMPRSRDEYRRMIESIDLSNASTHELYAALIGMSGVMDQILPSADALTRTLARLTGNVSTALDGMITATGEAQQAAVSAAGLWYSAAATIRDTLIKMRGTAGALITAQKARAFNEAQYQTLLARSMAGDATAVQQITGAAQTMLSSIRDTSATRIEAALAEARVLSDLGLLQGVADIEGARHDVIAGLLGQQIDVLTDARDLLANGGSMDEAAIAALNATLGSLSGAIAAAEQISYASLKARLDLTMGSIDASSLPPRLRAMLSGAADSISAQVDFIARSELPADLKWLALTGTSEHITTVQYLAENELGAGLTRLALTDVAQIQRTINLVAGSELPRDAMRVALATSSELSRTVSATLASDISPAAMRLALGRVSDLAVRVNAVLAGGLANPLRRLLRLAPEGMEGRITLGGSFVFDPSTGFSTWFELRRPAALSSR